jgi:hypothetical protein
VIGGGFGCAAAVVWSSGSSAAPERSRKRRSDRIASRSSVTRSTCAIPSTTGHQELATGNELGYAGGMASAAAILVPHPDDRVLMEDAALDASVVLSAEQAAAYVRWLETGEGECPIPDDFG